MPFHIDAVAHKSFSASLRNASGTDLAIPSATGP
jgi:hypothetical protein